MKSIVNGLLLVTVLLATLAGCASTSMQNADNSEWMKNDPAQYSY